LLHASASEWPLGGWSGVLVMRGEACVGKTALLRYSVGGEALEAVLATSHAERASCSSGGVS